MQRSIKAGAVLLGGFVLVLAAYANFFHNGFHFDDDHVIVENAAIRSLSSWPRFFTDAHTFSSLPANATYRPIVTLSYAADYAVHHSLDPVPFHVTQLLLLLIVGTLLVLVYRRLFGTEQEVAAVAAATLFCVHTANTETMNFLSSRSELLSAAGLLGAFVVFIRWPNARRYGLYLIPLAIGALAKAPVVIFAGIVIAWERMIERRSWPAALRAAVPSLVAGILLLTGLNAMNASEWIAGGGSRVAYLRTQPYVWLHYARLSLVPAGLTADTDLKPFVHWYDTEVVAGLIFVGCLAAAAVRLARTRETAPIAFGLTWFAITLLPTSSIFPLAEVANEHRLFFPLMGVAPAIVWSAERIARRSLAVRRVVTAAVAVLILALAWGTHERNKTWRSEETLWLDVTQKSPRNGRGWMNYGLTQMSKGKYAEAKAAFDRAAQYSPAYPVLEINRGIVTDALGNHEEAERFFRRALELSSDRNSHFYYGRWLLNRGRGAEGSEHLAQASKLAPTWMPPRHLQLQIAIARNDPLQAHALAREIIAIDPTDPLATSLTADGLDPRCGDYGSCFRRAFAEAKSGDHLQAAVDYRAALRFGPHPAAYNNLGWSLAALGFRSDAAQNYRAALSLDPRDRNAQNNLLALEFVR